MQKKHAFSPNHKVVSGKHNFHPQGQPSTASMGGPPQSVGGESGPADGSSAGGGMDGMNFCNGGMKYADGGETDHEILGGGVRGTLSDYGNAIKQTASEAVSSIGHSLGLRSAEHPETNPPTRREKQINDEVDKDS